MIGGMVDIDARNEAKFSDVPEGSADCEAMVLYANEDVLAVLQMDLDRGERKEVETARNEAMLVALI